MCNLKKSLDAFLLSEMRVAVIKGPWGVGKTHFWNQFISDYIKTDKAKTYAAYSYISLFGKSDISDIKREIFQSSSKIEGSEFDSLMDKELQTTSNYFQQICNWFFSKKDKLLQTGNLLPQAKAYSELIEFLQYKFVNKYLICIDDVERKGEKLSIKELMGLVDELADKKLCKVVIIFNEDELNHSADDYSKYREKTVDIEFKYNPSHTKNFDTVFGEDRDFYTRVLYCTKLLDIKNIRVLKKVKWVLTEISPIMRREPHDDAIEQVVDHVVLFCWSYFRCEGSLELDFIQQKIHEISWLSSIIDEEAELSEDEKKYKSISSAMGLQPLSIDEDILSLLKSGYLDDASFTENYENHVKAHEFHDVRHHISKVRKLYSESFADNLSMIEAEFISILNAHMDKIGFHDFDGIVKFLDEFTSVSSEQYVDMYINTNMSVLEVELSSKRSTLIEKIKHNYFLTKLNEIKPHPSIQIDEIALKIAEHGGWDHEDINFLISLDQDDYISWIKSGPDDLVVKLRAGLLSFRHLSTSDKGNSEKYEKIANSVVNALKSIGQESLPNKARVEAIYAVNVD